MVTDSGEKGVSKSASNRVGTDKLNDVYGQGTLYVTLHRLLPWLISPRTIFPMSQVQNPRKALPYGVASVEKACIGQSETVRGAGWRQGHVTVEGRMLGYLDGDLELCMIEAKSPPPYC